MRFLQSIISLLTVAFVVVLAIAPAAQSQPLVNTWARGFGNDQVDRLWAVATDSAGNAVITGYHQGSVDIGGGLLAGAGSADIFVAKFDPAGQHLWSRSFGSSGWDEGLAIACDPTGNVVVAGAVEGTIDFGGWELSGPGGFIAKFDATGNHLWSRVITAAAPGLHQFRGVAADADGNIVVTGNVLGPADFGGGATTGAYSMFVAKYDMYGSPIWSHRIGSAGESSLLDASDVATDSADNVIITGAAGVDIDFGGTLLSPQGGHDIVLAKYDAAGNHLWSQLVGGTEDDFGSAVDVDSYDRIVVTGNFHGTVKFHPRGDEYTSDGGSDVFVTWFGPNGRNQDYRTNTFGGPGGDASLDVAVNSSGEVAVTGIMGTDTAGTDIFLAVVQGSFYHQIVYYGGAGTDRGAGVAIGDDRSIFLAGDFEGPVDLGSGPLTGRGYQDIFLAGIETAVPQIDVSPGACDNVLNVTPFVRGNAGGSHGGGVIRAVLLSNGVFDVHDVDVSSLNAIGVSPMSYRYKDVGTPADNRAWLSVDCPRLLDEWCPGRGGDGRDDLVLTFSKRDVIESGGLSHMDDGMLYPLGFFGLLLDGQGFGVFDCLTIVNSGMKDPDDERQLTEGRTGPAVILEGAAPNPFNPTTTISYTLRDPARVRLFVFDVRGRLAATLVNADQAAGDHSVTWQADGAASGVYFYRFQAGSFTETRKLVILK